MEIIKKTINLDEHRSHRVGVLKSIPYGGFNFIEGENYGNYIADSKEVKYLDLLRKYNTIQEMLKNGIYLKKVNDGKYIEYDSIVKTNCGEKIDIPSICQYDFVPYNKLDFIFDNINCYTTDNNCKDDLIVLLSDLNMINETDIWWGKLTNSIGVFQFCKDFEKLAFGNSNCDGANDVALIFDQIPTIDIPLFLVNDTLNEEIYQVYEYNVINNKIIPIDETKKLKSEFIEFYTDILYVESKLSTFKSSDTVYINDKIHGIFKEDGKIYKYKNGVWSVVDDSTIDSYICGDGENISSNEKKYRNIPLKSCVYYYEPDMDDDGVYYFLVKYENNENSLFKIPYIKDEKMNINTYFDIQEGKELTIYDKIKNIEISEDKKVITITYAIGLTDGNDKTGIHYKEVYGYSIKKEEVIIDNKYKCIIFYEDIDYDSKKVYSYNNELKAERLVNVAVITAMEVMKGWDKTPLLITKHNTDALQEEPKYNINLNFNRGASVAWENHFKLSECNTMEDLENYGNNYFNL